MVKYGVHRKENLKPKHIEKLVEKCGFMDITEEIKRDVDPNVEVAIRNDDEELVFFPNLKSACDYLIGHLVTKKIMDDLPDVN